MLSRLLFWIMVSVILNLCLCLVNEPFANPEEIKSNDQNISDPYLLFSIRGENATFNLQNVMHKKNKQNKQTDLSKMKNLSYEQKNSNNKTILFIRDHQNQQHLSQYNDIDGLIRDCSECVWRYKDLVCACLAFTALIIAIVIFVWNT